MNMVLAFLSGGTTLVIVGILIKLFRNNKDQLEKFWTSLDDRLEEVLKRKFGITFPQIFHTIHDEFARRTIVWMEKYCFTREFLMKFVKSLQKGEIPNVNINLDDLFESLKSVEDVKEIVNATEDLKKAFNKFKEKEVVDIVVAEAVTNGQPITPEKAVEVVRANVLAAKPITNSAEAPATKEDLIKSFEAQILKSRARKEELKK